MSMGRRTDLVDEFGRIRWDDRVNLWAIVCSKPIDFVGNYYVEDMPMAYQQEGLNVRFSGVGYSLEEGKIPPTMLLRLIPSKWEQGIPSDGARPVSTNYDGHS